MSSSMHKDLLTKHAKLLPPTGLGARQSHGKRSRNAYNPLPWSDFFDRCNDVSVNGNMFRVYSKGGSGPLLYLLHGGGHSALSWAVFVVHILELVECQVLAIDIRGHGNTVTTDDGNLSQEVLVNDIISVLNTIYGDEVPPTIIMGHSMGGAIAVRTAATGRLSCLVGLAVIDVVEGTAMESLGAMQSFLRGRPKDFKSLETAIEWSIRSGQLRNKTSARVSVPGQLQKVTKQESLSPGSDSCLPHPLGGASVRAETIVEGDEGDKKETTPLGNSPPTELYTWRIDLSKTEPYWAGWFRGLSGVFLSVPSTISKILILAGVDRLDKELTIGQMQGKFQMQVLSGCGHAVHEDLPDKVAEIIAGFLTRHKFAVAKEGFQRPIPAC